jgi:uncharacterized membrane protein YgdD (TMEM256/DUF423 family)
MTAGAFGAHGLRQRFPTMPEKTHASWGTASSYLIYNGLALLALSYHPDLKRRYKAAPWFIGAGAMVFSGTIFGLVLSAEGSGIRKILGPLTPLGGIFMIGGLVPSAIVEAGSLSEY